MNGHECSVRISQGHTLFTRQRLRRFVAVAAAFGALVFFAGGALATPVGMVQATINQVFSGSATPTGNQPWLTATFEDSASPSAPPGLLPGQVKVTLSITGLVAPEKVDGWYINVDDGHSQGTKGTIDPTTLSFSAPTKVGTFDDPTINLGTDKYKADGDGLYDIRFDFSTSNGHEFGAGDSVSYIITGPAFMDASSFTFFSAPAGGVGPFYEAAHILSIGQGGNSVWASPTDRPGNPVPEPSAIILGLVGGCAALGLRYWKRAA
jgi:hypothetical protein